MALHSSTLAWKIPWMEEPGRLQSMGSRKSDTTERLHFHFSLSGIGERNGNPLQCSCLENPRDGGTWWAAVCGVAHSRTRLKWLSSSSILPTPYLGLLLVLIIGVENFSLVRWLHILFLALWYITLYMNHHGSPVGPNSPHCNFLISCVLKQVKLTAL